MFIRIALVHLFDNAMKHTGHPCSSRCHLHKFFPSQQFLWFVISCRTEWARNTKKFVQFGETLEQAQDLHNPLHQTHSIMGLLHLHYSSHPQRGTMYKNLINHWNVPWELNFTIPTLKTTHMSFPSISSRKNLRVVWAKILSWNRVHQFLTINLIDKDKAPLLERTKFIETFFCGFCLTKLKRT